MNTISSSHVHFFETLRDTVTSKPYAILSSEEVNSLVNQIDSLAKAAIAQGGAFECVCAFRQAINNARVDGYYPIVILPFLEYQTALSYFRSAS
jgi:hypothetical protein